MNQPWEPPQQGVPGGYGQPGQHQQPGQYAQAGQYQQAGPAAGQGQVVVDIKHHPMAFIYGFRAPVITLNGRSFPGRWGPNALPLPPGNHDLRIHVPYFLPPEVGRVAATVPVQPGQQLHLEYRAPMIAFMGGALGPPPQKWPGAALSWVLIGVAVLLVPLLAIVMILSGA
ncbi:hypothetical protein OHR68_36290 [Spirillospora sp. NBC_00431]